MFARVYPIMRLPRRFGVFDYRIPDGLNVRPGDCVRVPFHGRVVFAVVADVTETTEVRSELATVESIVEQQWIDVPRFERLARNIAQSVPSLLYHAFASLNNDRTSPRAPRGATARPSSFHRDVVATIGAALAATTPQVSVQTSIEGTCLLVQKLRERHVGQLLVVCPLEREAEAIAAAIPIGDRVAVLHGKTAPKERERIMWAWRDGRIHTLIGTRLASLLQPHTLAAVVITQSGNSEHFNDRRNPRFDARNAAWLLAAAAKAPLYACDPLPRPEDAAYSELIATSPATCDIIDLKQPEEISSIPFVTTTTREAVNSALQSGKNVLLFFNRKGVAKRAQCKACNTVLTCTACGAPWTAQENTLLACPRCLATSPLPDACPACEHGRVGLRGIGNAHIEEALAEYFPGISIARIEKGKTSTDARILIATEYYFTSLHRPFAEKRFGLIADLCIDLTQRGDDFRSAELTARKLHRLALLAQQQGARGIVQTWLPQHIETMRDGRAFLTEEHTLRANYGLPPATALITVRHADAEAIMALTGGFFIPKDDLMGSEGRIAYDQLDDALARLTPLPDTAVISVDYHYGNPHRPYLPQS